MQVRVSATVLKVRSVHRLATAGMLLMTTHSPGWGVHRNDVQGCSIDELEGNDAKFFKTLEAEVKSVNR